jgi:hypothetical protein
MMIFAVLLSVSALTVDTELVDLDTIKAFDASTAKELAEAAHLPPLEASRDEVRVWAESAFFDGVSGWVITKSELRVYSSAPGAGDSGGSEKDHLRLERTIRDGGKASALLRDFARLSELNGKDYVCGLDGSAFALEGVVSGRHFSLSAMNPGFCEDAGAKQFAHLISKLARVGRGTP